MNDRERNKRKFHGENKWAEGGNGSEGDEGGGRRESEKARRGFSSHPFVNFLSIFFHC